MKSLVVTLAVAALTLGTLSACKDQAATQADIKKSANPEGQQLRKKYEEAGKQADERRKAE